MADVTIFRGAAPVLIGVPVDLRVSEVHKKESLVTQQPLEDGSIVSDHIILQPDTVEITAIISNYDGPLVPAIGARAKTAWQELARLRKLQVLFDVLTTHELYTDMAITSITGGNLAPNQGELRLSVTLQKVDRTRTSVVASSESAAQSTGDAPVSKTSSSEVDAGRIDPVKEEDNRSLAAQIADGLAGAQ
ncbi:MAG: hypothetical protein JKY94_17805 [Rhodobacteraceae bacterium]|nr:hypothetical protein [Paracoccaceae bacterium]